MYSFLFHGSDSEYFNRLKEGLSSSIQLQMFSERASLLDYLDTERFCGLVLAFNGDDPETDDLHYLQSIVGLPQVPGIVVLASHLTLSQAVCCMRCGAYDCLSGPISGKVLNLVLSRMMKSPGDDISSQNGILGDSSVMIEFRKQIQRHAECDHTILITGETGSGKELTAQSLHLQSSRRDKPFVAVNCASYSDDLLGSELFGSRRGAFTGSVDRAGLFESANGGTIFLDEIGELSPRAQVLLLRTVEEKNIRRMGSNQTKDINVRIIAATNKNLPHAIKQNTFRSDLYFRLNLLNIEVPPLRKHKEDIPVIVQSYLTSISNKPKRIDNFAMMALINHHWPGNVRELQSVVLKALLNGSDHRIWAKDLSFFS